MGIVDPVKIHLLALRACIGLSSLSNSEDSLACAACLYWIVISEQQFAVLLKLQTAFKAREFDYFVRYQPLAVVQNHLSFLCSK